MKPKIELKVEGASLSMAQLKRRLLMQVSEFAKDAPMFGGIEMTEGKVPYRIDSRYFFKDNGSNILAVAHLDVAMYLEDVSIIPLAGDKVVFSPHLDDRLGAYIILDVLPRMGINVDVLLTVGEESCASTAQNFVTDKQYNWGLSFDRRGEDVVTYQYSGKEWEQSLRDAGFKVGMGSYSDIAELDSLGCKFVNIGCGYHNEHSDLCHARLSQTLRQLERFAIFYREFQGMWFQHTKSGYGRYHKSYQSWGDDAYGGYGTSQKWPAFNHCSKCNAVLLPEEEDSGVCEECIVQEEEKYAKAGKLGDQWDDYTKLEFEGRTYFRDETGDEVMSSDGRPCCPGCLVELMPHEEQQNCCDDCFQQEKGGRKHEEIDDD